MLPDGLIVTREQFSDFGFENIKKVENVRLAPRLLAREVADLLLQFHRDAVGEMQRQGTISSFTPADRAGVAERNALRAVERLEAVNSAMDAFREVFGRMGEREIASRLRPVRH